MKFTLTQTVNATADKVWATISDFGGVGAYFSAVQKCTVTGNGVGAVRTLTTPTENGNFISYDERLEEIDHASRRLTYSIPDAHLFPIQDGYTGTMSITPQADHCILEWSADVAPRNCPEEEARAFVAAVYTEAFAGLDRLFPGTAN